MRKSCPFTQNKHTFVLFAMFSREDKIFIVEKWYETRSLAFIRRAFRHSGVTLPFGAPLLIFFAAPHKFLTVSKKIEKKRVATFFFGFSYRLIAPLELFVPQIFFSRPPNAKLAEIWSILLPRRTIFLLKNIKIR